MFAKVPETAIWTSEAVEFAVLDDASLMIEATMVCVYHLSTIQLSANSRVVIGAELGVGYPPLEAASDSASMIGAVAIQLVSSLVTVLDEAFVYSRCTSTS